LYLRKVANLLANSNLKLSISKYYFCDNNKEQLGEACTLLLNILLTIKRNYKVFDFLVDEINKEKNIEAKELLADDMINIMNLIPLDHLKNHIKATINII